MLASENHTSVHQSGWVKHCSAVLLAERLVGHLQETSPHAAAAVHGEEGYFLLMTIHRMEWGYDVLV